MKKPWYQGFNTKKNEKVILGQDEQGNKGFPIFILDSGSEDIHIEHMLNCVNSHDELVEALKGLLNNLTNDDLETFEIKAREALKTAESEAVK